MNRRRFVFTAGSGLTGIFAGCIDPGDPIDTGDPAHLTSRPITPTKSPETGRHPLGLGIDRDGFLYVPPGATNGDLFTHMIGFSPGFYQPDRLRGKPKVFLSHGRSDPILPFAWTSAALAPSLTSMGYSVKFEQFEGGHQVPLAIAADAMDWFKSG